MLHAELQGKLDAGAADLERREDVLTSTIFGTLLLASDGPTVLAEWLNRARRLGKAGRLDSFGNSSLGLLAETPAAWFWPSLSHAEPDVVLRIGSTLLIVEAKYGSGKGMSQHGEGDTGTPDGIDSQSEADQLFREWRSVQIDESHWYMEGIRNAIHSCDAHLVYLVSARHESAALRELAESQAKIHDGGMDASMWLLTWQDLHAALLEKFSAPSTASWWTASLKQLLERRNLAAFLGFSKTLGAWNSPPQSLEHWAGRWQKDELGAMTAGFGMELAEFHRMVGVVDSWAGRAANNGAGYFPTLSKSEIQAIRWIGEHALTRESGSPEPGS